MLQLTMSGDYAVRAMLYLVRRPAGSIAQITEIAEAGNIPEALLRKIIPLLKHAGLVRSLRGTGGGISLAKSPDCTTLLDVVEAVEGKIVLNKCLFGPGTCVRDTTCHVHKVWCDAQNRMNEVLTSKTLAELA